MQLFNSQNVSPSFSKAFTGLPNGGLAAISGVPPLIVSCTEISSAKKIVIYGNTVNDNGVGNPTDTGMYVIPLIISGKNLLNINDVAENQFLLPGGELYPNTAWDTTNYIPIYNAKTLTISEKNKNYYFQYNVGFYTSSHTLISVISIAEWGTRSQSVNVPSGTCYVRVSWGKIIGSNPCNREEIMLETNSSATQYEEYHHPLQININSEVQLYRSADQIILYPQLKQSFIRAYTNQAYRFTDISGLQGELPLPIAWEGTCVLYPDTVVLPSQISIVF